MPRAGALLVVALTLALPALAGQAPATRSPEEERARWDRIFTTEPAHIRWAPSRFLMEVAPTLKAGEAIDVGMGSGRNALYLAQSGWRVTGVDTSAVGVERARSRAAADKLPFTAVRSDMFQFDYGTNRYGLVLFMYMGPVADLGERFVRALKPGGYLLVEHFAGGFEAGSLPTLFNGLDVVLYHEVEDFPDYDLRNKSRVVRFLARKAL
jgi:SAM-dependent methyltransferase